MLRRFLKLSFVTGLILFNQFLYGADKAILNLTSSGVAIHGYDPVGYKQGGPVKGSEEYYSVFNSAKYLFADEVNRQRFLIEPDKYIPAYGGWCAWAMLDGEKIDIDPESYKIVNGVTYLYYNSFFAGTLKKWNMLAETKTDQELVDKADAHWQLLSSNPAAE